MKTILRENDAMEKIAEEYLDSISDKIFPLFVCLKNVNTSVSSSTNHFMKPTMNNEVLKAHASYS